MNSLKILNIATHDYGGAGTASLYINEQLRDAGLESKMIVWDKKSDSVDVVKCRLYSKNPISAKMYRMWNRAEGKKWWNLKSDYGFTAKTVFDPQSSYASAKSIISQIGFIPDLILFHWVSFFMTPRIIYDFKKITGAKMAWLMLDNSPLTGGCHYPFKCEGYQLECRNCPLFRVDNKISQMNLAAKLQWLPDDLEFWGTSSDVTRAKIAALGKTRIARPVLFPIDEMLISNDSKDEVRIAWGLPISRKLILIGCTDLNDVRKGGEYLMSALILLKERCPNLFSNVSIVLVGDNRSDIFQNIGYDIHPLGRLSLPDLMKIYNAVDFFLSTSIEDSGPLMINQSIASGTPVVSFDVGVAKDLVFSGITGYRARLEDIDDLLNGIVMMLMNKGEEERSMYNACKELYFAKKRELSLLSCINAIIYR